VTLSSSTKDLYSGVEFSTWLDLEQLWPEEEYLIKKYLNPQLSVVEAGVNGGRIVLKMQELGFTNLAGFDYIAELIAKAIERDPDRTIDFQVQDAIELAYPDRSFDQIIYLQQIICLIEGRANRLKAVQESYRILKQGGIGIFSVLSFESRNSHPIYSIYFKYLTLLRKLRGEDLSIQYLPWLKLGGKFNFNALLDRPPYTYWYQITEIHELLKSVGFEIVGMGTDSQIKTDSLNATDRELYTEEISGMLYIVVKKRQ
jgi:ubiquinone/menaquinone biosynthesis C-methylase UbiE